MQQDSLSYKTLRNAVYLFMGFLLPMFLNIIVVREVVKNIGTAEYGVLVLVGTITAFLGYVDVGFTTAFTKYVAEYHAQGDRVRLERLLGSARSLLTAAGLVSLLVLTVIGKWLLPYFNITSQSYDHIFIVFVLYGFIMLFNSLDTLYTVVPIALQRYDILAKIGMVHTIVVGLGTVVLVTMGFKLKALAALTALAAFALLFVYRYVARRLMPNLDTRFRWEKDEIIKAYKFGLLTFSSNLAGSLLIYLDRLIIPVYLNPRQLTFYSVPGNVALKTSSVTQTIAQMLFPMASALSGLGDIERLKAIYIRAFRNLTIIAAAITGSIILFADKILYFWLGVEFVANSTVVLVISALAYFAVALYIPLQSMLMGLGELRFLIKLSVTMVVFNVVLLLLFVPRWGIEGAAWAFLASIVPMLYAFYWVERKLFNFSDIFRRYARLYAKILLVSLLHAALLYIAVMPLVTSVLTLVVLGPVSVLLYFVLYFLIGFVDEEDRQTFLAFARQFWPLKILFR